MIAGLELPTSGKIYLDQDEVSLLRASERDIAFVFQLFALYPHMNVKNNLAFPLKMQKYSRIEIKERVMEAAKLLRIDNILDAKISSLAGGDRQRVALGRALVRRPKAFLMDEPLGTLDSEFRELMCLELRKLHDDIDATTVYVTHDQQEAMSMADRIAVMNEGEILQADTPSIIYNKPKSKFVASFIGSPAMNFIPFNQAVQKNQTEIHIEGIKIIIPSQHENSTGQENFLGIRPENLKLVSNGGITGNVFGIEYLGSRKIVTIDTSFGKVKIRVDSNVNLNIEENVQFTPSNNNQIIFDGKTDKSLISEFLS
jgi:multiple sugar transport system ATP-binding protein